MVGFAVLWEYGAHVDGDPPHFVDEGHERGGGIAQVYQRSVSQKQVTGRAGLVHNAWHCKKLGHFALGNELQAR